jgi:glycosyltransferase involved in cell wall biosynthesis
MRVSYVSACLDASGYAEAARNHIAALHTAGVKVDVKPVSFEGFKSDLGKLGNLVHSMINNKAANDIQILHLTPQNYRKFTNNAKYNIGYCAWETSKLPDKWVPYINGLDEVWVPCEHNKQVFVNSGIQIPIQVMPHPLNEEYIETAGVAESFLSNRALDEFMFYSIFQWHERKNPLALLKAYLTEFTSEDKVVLVLKTYLANPSNSMEVQKIKQLIREVKAKLYLKDYPKILLVSTLLSRGQIQALHEQGDCFVSFHRCEGFGLPIAEASLAGNPVITTGYGGPDDFVTEDTGILVDYSMTPCYGMPWDHYNGHMQWADPDVMSCKRALRKLYEDRELVENMGTAGAKLIREEFSWPSIGEKMKKRLEKIQETL